MAQKRAPRARSAAKGKAPEPGPRRTVLTIKGTDEWRAWLEELGQFLRTPTSTIVDHALVEYARAKGFKKDAPLR